MVHSFTTSDPDINKLLTLSSNLFDLKGATELLHWDQETYMPPKGILHRGRQLATLSAVFHEKLTDKEIGKLVNILEDKIKSFPEKFNDTDKGLVREVKRAHEKAIKIPKKLVRELSEISSTSLEIWKTARYENNYNLFKDSLEKLIKLKIEYVNVIGYKNSPYDALLDDHEPDLTTIQVTKLFTPLKKEIITVLKKVQNKPLKEPKSILRGQKYTRQKMIEITEKILEKIGYDFKAGRQDLSTHPFTLNFGHRDVRVTNRFIPNDLRSSIFSAIHEGGHALYELGIDDTIGNTFLAAGSSLGIHESQSRLWENFVGRSLQFWQFWVPQLNALLPKQIGRFTATDIYNEVNQVKPGFIRVDADEVTYNLHVIIRFEIEKDLFENKIKVADLPEIWNHKYQEALNIRPPNDSLGVLQDIHWSQGSMGYFPTYTLGNLYAAQIWNTINIKIPKISSHIASGNFYPLLDWLRENIHRYGSIYKTSDLIVRVTGQPLNPQYFIKYLNQKFI